MNIAVIDVETAYDPIIEDGVVIDNAICEIGVTKLFASETDLLGRPMTWEVGHTISWLVKPKHPIKPHFSAIHNITDEDVKFASVWDVAVHLLSSMLTDSIACAAHNTKTEETLLADCVNLPWICTYRTAVRIWPDFSSHSNGSVRYHLNPIGLDRAKAGPTHRAGPDSYVSAFILREALNSGKQWEHLADWTQQPLLLPRCKIGKWRNGGEGTPWAEVDSGFLEWLLPRDFDDDVKFTARHHLEQREIDQRIEAEEADLRRQVAANNLSAPSQELPF